MAVATPTTLTKNGSITDATSYTTASVTFTAGRFYLLTFVSRTGITADPTQPTATGTGMTFTVVPTNGTQVYDNSSSSRKRQTLFYGLCSSNTTTTVVFDEAGQTQTDAEWCIDEIASGLVITGTNGINAIVQSAKNLDATATTNTITATLAAFASANNATYGSFAEGNGSTLTVGSGFTSISESHVNGSCSLLTEFNVGNDTTVNATNGINSELGAIALELQAEVVAATTTSSTLSMMGVG